MNSLNFLILLNSKYLIPVSTTLDDVIKPHPSITATDLHVSAEWFLWFEVATFIHPMGRQNENYVLIQ